MCIYIRYTSLSSSHTNDTKFSHISLFFHFYQQVHMKKKKKINRKKGTEKGDTRDTRKKKIEKKNRKNKTKTSHLPTRSRCHRSHLGHTKNGTSKPHQRDQIHPNHSRQSPIGKDITRRRQDRSPCHHQSGREAENGDKGEVSSEFLFGGGEEKGKKMLLVGLLSLSLFSFFLSSLSWGVVVVLLYILVLFPCDAYPFDHPLCPFFRAANLSE